MLESFGPERTVEDVLAGRLRVTLGGEQYVLPVRSIASNRRWVESLDAEMGSVLVAVIKAGDEMDMSGIGNALLRLPISQLLDLVIAYDEAGVLPPKAELEEVTRPHEVLAALHGIRRVENPLADAGLTAISSVIAGMQSPAPTNSPHGNGASRRRKRSTKA